MHPDNVKAVLADFAKEDPECAKKHPLNAEEISKCGKDDKGTYWVTWNEVIKKYGPLKEDFWDGPVNPKLFKALKNIWMGYVRKNDDKYYKMKNKRLCNRQLGEVFAIKL